MGTLLPHICHVLQAMALILILVGEKKDSNKKHLLVPGYNSEGEEKKGFTDNNPACIKLYW